MLLYKTCVQKRTGVRLGARSVCPDTAALPATVLVLMFMPTLASTAGSKQLPVSGNNSTSFHNTYEVLIFGTG